MDISDERIAISDEQHERNLRDPKSTTWYPTPSEQRLLRLLDRARAGRSLVDGDYELGDGAAWFSSKGFSVRIRTTDDGISVDIYRDGHEADGYLTTCSAFFSELNSEDET